MLACRATKDVLKNRTGLEVDKRKHDFFFYSRIFRGLTVSFKKRQKPGRGKRLVVNALGNGDAPTDTQTDFNTKQSTQPSNQMKQRRTDRQADRHLCESN